MYKEVLVSPGVTGTCVPPIYEEAPAGSPEEGFRGAYACEALQFIIKMSF